MFRRRAVEAINQPFRGKMLAALKQQLFAIIDTHSAFFIGGFWAVVAVFSPLKQMFCALIFLIVVDTATGIAASLIKHNKITSRKLSRTVSKTFVYLTTVCVCYIANKYLLGTGPFSLPLDTLIVAWIAFTELTSIFENLQKISNQPFLQFLVDKLASDKSAIRSQLEEQQEKTSGTSNE